MAGSRKEQDGFFLHVGDLHAEDDPQGRVQVVLYQALDDYPDYVSGDDGMLLSNALVSALSEVVAAFRTNPELIITAYLAERKRKLKAELVDGEMYISALKKRQNRKKVTGGK